MMKLLDHLNCLVEFFDKDLNSFTELRSEAYSYSDQEFKVILLPQHVLRGSFKQVRLFPYWWKIFRSKKSDFYGMQPQHRRQNRIPQTKNKAPSFGFAHTEFMKKWEQKLKMLF